MGIREIAKIVLSCCQAVVTETFDEADAPFLAPLRLRKNVICPACAALVIVTITRNPGGNPGIEQEVIR